MGPNLHIGADPFGRQQRIGMRITETEQRLRDLLHRYLNRALTDETRRRLEAEVAVLLKPICSQLPEPFGVRVERSGLNSLDVTFRDQWNRTVEIDWNQRVVRYLNATGQEISRHAFET